MNLEQITTSLQTRPSRRNALRALVGSALGLAVVRLPEDGEARKRKKRKKSKKQPSAQTCVPGTSLGIVKVPATGAKVSTPALAAGQRYRLQANGYWNTNASYGADAFASFKFANSSDIATTYQGVRIGLAVDGGSPDAWGSYHITHNYEREITGKGAPLTLHYTDPVTSDNSGSLTVDVICA
ncbi:MAG: hypothetical protein R2853_21795 [Thermomicrobiales bacterium]